MSVRTSKRGKSSHEQKPVGAAAGGLLFMGTLHPKPTRGAAGGLLFLRSPKAAAKHRLKRPVFEHIARGARRR